MQAKTVDDRNSWSTKKPQVSSVTSAECYGHHFKFTSFVTTYITNMWWNAYVFLGCCMHVVLDLGLWRISAQETRGPCGPLMGTELSYHRGMLQGTDTHTHTHSECIPLRCSTHNKSSYKHLQHKHLRAFWRRKARVCERRECKYRGSISVDCIHCCDMRVSWRPRASLRGLGSSG